MPDTSITIFGTIEQSLFQPQWQVLAFVVGAVVQVAGS